LACRQLVAKPIRTLVAIFAIEHSPGGAMIYVFGEEREFELDERLFQLRKNGCEIALAPRTFDVLLYLVRNRDHVVSKSELLESVWDGENVSESVLPSNVTALRRALADERASARVIQTVHGRGYRFVAQIEEHAGRDPAPGDAGVEVAATAPAVVANSEAGPFVGRGEVMTQLRGHLDRALAGTGSLVLLVGEPGIGKTRTAGELAAEAAALGARVLHGRCYEGEGAPAYWPWVQILRELVRGITDPARLRERLGAGVTDVAQLVPELHARMGEIPTAQDLHSEHARFRLFDSVASFIRSTSGERPLVLVLDDLHSADAPTLLLLRFLAGELRRARVLMLGAYRDVEVRRDHPLAHVAGELARDPNFHRIPLRGLGEDDVARFVEAAAGAASSESVVRAVYEMSEGNPFFLQETVRLFVAEGRFGASREEGEWRVILPQGVRDVIGRRLDTLSRDCNRLLGLAAVIGRDFALNVLHELAALPADEVLGLIDEAIATRIVVASSADDDAASLGRYAFSHALIRETLYEELSGPERVRLHHRTGEVLEAIYGGDIDAHLPELAHHFFQGVPGGDVARAVDYAERAAQSALHLLAFEEGVLQYRRALQALEFHVPVDEVRRCELTLGLGWALAHAGRDRDRREGFKRAAELARRIERPDLLARAAMGMGGWPLEAGDGPTHENADFRSLAEEALADLPEGETALRACLLAGLAVTPPDQDSMEGRDRLSREALDLARSTGDPDALFDAYAARQWALVGPDDTARRLELATALLELGRKVGARDRTFTGHEDRIRCHLVLGDIAAADADLEACQRLADELRLPRYRFSVTRFRLARAFGDGRFDDSLDLIERFYELGTAAGEAHNVEILRRYWGIWLMRERGELEGVDAALLGEIAQDAEWRGYLGNAILAMLHNELGQPDKARQMLDRLAAHDFADIPRDENWLFALFLIANTCSELADAGRAAVLYPLLLPYAPLNVAHQTARLYMGSALHWLARLAAVSGERERALAHFEAARVANEGLGARPALLRTRCEMGLLLLGARSGDAGAPAADQRSRGRALLAEVAVDAEALGMSGVARRAREAL
jgi:DNA-binding winged helix-turn-helix (wHTH) protein/tetratricopeptide (TPR) repeat protein